MYRSTLYLEGWIWFAVHGMLILEVWARYAKWGHASCRMQLQKPIDRRWFGLVGMWQMHQGVKRVVLQSTNNYNRVFSGFDKQLLECQSRLFLIRYPTAHTLSLHQCMKSTLKDEYGSPYITCFGFWASLRIRPRLPQNADIKANRCTKIRLMLFLWNIPAAGRTPRHKKALGLATRHLWMQSAHPKNQN